MSNNARLDFETVLQLFHKKVYNLIYRLVGNGDDAADLAQETFIKAFKAYNKFAGPEQAVYPWLCRIAVNCCKNNFKRSDRVNKYEAVSSDRLLDTGDSTVEIELKDDSADPAGIFDRKELEAVVHEAIGALPSEFRVVVVLRDIQGLSYKEIADATGETMDIVKVRLHRGRGMLKRRLLPYLS
jgi:RNA polymerase sigma-70 factor, ECF subfamily